MMQLDLTMADFDMLNDALFQRAGDAATEREEGRWLALQAKLDRAALDLEREACDCGHARKSHRGDGKAKCIICHCPAFADQPDGPRLNDCTVDESSNPEACFYDPDDAMYSPAFCHAHGEEHSAATREGALR